MKFQQPLKAVLLDLDGTLVEFKFNVKDAKNAMIAWLGKNGFSTTNLSDSLKSQEIIDRAQAQWSSSRDLQTRMEFENVKESLFLLLEEFEYKGFLEAEAFPGSVEFLKTLADSNVPSAIVTNSGRKPVNFAIEKFGFQPYVTQVITRNDVKKLKPYPDSLLLALELLGIGNKDTIYVGDSVIDIEAARRAGIKSVGLLSGMLDKQILSQARPDFMIRDISELAQLVFGQDI